MTPAAPREEARSGVSSRAHTQAGFGAFTRKTITPSAIETRRIWMIPYRCDRHCCLCKRQCDVFIEVHHIVPQAQGGEDDESNAMPLCFDCHAKVSHYDHAQPLGTKCKPNELRRRRDQVYDEFTRHLVPALHYQVPQAGRVLPDVGFIIQHPGHAPPVQLLVTLDTYVDGVLRNREDCDPLYRGKTRWNLNPNSGVNGHFAVVDDACAETADVRIGINLTIHDIYDRPHSRLPVMWVHDRPSNCWWLDPVDPTEIQQRIARPVAKPNAEVDAR